MEFKTLIAYQKAKELYKLISSDIVATLIADVGTDLLKCRLFAVD